MLAHKHKRAKEILERYQSGKEEAEVVRTLAEEIKQRIPKHPMWSSKGLSSWRFSDYTVSTIDGTIVAIAPSRS